VNSRRHLLRTAVLAAVLLALLPACGGGARHPVKMGLKRVGLDLAFKPDKDDPINLPPVLAPIPEFALDPGGRLTVVPPLAPRPSRFECPKAPPGAVPAAAVTSIIDKPPRRGEVTLRNTGTLNLTAGAFTFNGNYPPYTTKVIDKVDIVTPPPDAFGQQGASTIEFDVVKPLGDTVFRDRLRATATELDLVEREIRTQKGSVIFRPTPAVELMALNAAEGDSWTSAGIDVDTGAAMTVQGLIVKREAVDLCGEMFDTYRVQSTERLVSLTGSTPYSVMTDDTQNTPGSTGPGSPNYYNVATHLGGLFLVDENHTKTTLTVDNVPVIVEIDVVSTQMSATPTERKA
jgi:hypothetical protein